MDSKEVYGIILPQLKNPANDKQNVFDFTEDCKLLEIQFMDTFKLRLYKSERDGDFIGN